MTYTLFWNTGDTEIITGSSIEKAMTRAGYGHGALPALSFYSPGDARAKHCWDGHRWIVLDSPTPPREKEE